MHRFWRPNDLRTFSVLLTAFAVIGMATSLALYVLMSERVWHDARAELSTIARMASLVVDGDRHETLQTPSQMGSLAYRQENLKLARVQSAAPKVRYIYTMRGGKDGTHFVLDPTKPGDADGDGVDDHSKLMEPYDEVDPYLQRALATGAPIVADEIFTDKWGSFLTGYAPILNSKGQCVAVLGVDMEAESLVATLQDIRWRAGFGLIVALIAGGLMAAFLANRRNPARIDRSAILLVFSRRSSGRLQLMTLAIVAGVMACGTSSYFLIRNDLDAKANWNARANDIHTIRAYLERAALAEEAGPSMEAMSHEKAFESFPALSRLRDHITEADVLNGSESRRLLGAMIVATQSAHSALQEERESLDIQAVSAQRQTLAALVIAIGLTLGAFALIRLAQRQQAKLLEAREIAERAQWSYRRVVESLPIGFFTYRRREVIFSNVAFDIQMGRRLDQSATEAFIEAMELSGQEEAIDQFSRSEAEREPFEIEFSLSDASGSTRHFESRGVPVFSTSGEFEHLVCFTLDVTDEVQASAALHRHSEEIEATNSRLQLANDELETNFEEMVRAFVKAIEAKDPYTAGHSERVMQYSVAIAQMAELPQTEIELLKKAALVHDVGKIGIPDGILTKPGKLTDEEFETIKRHVVIGAEMIKSIPLFSDCVPVVRWHHERMDGSGYPDGLLGDSIPPIVRIAAVADAFDAMTSTRAYRSGMSIDVAIAELRKDASNGKLDGKFVEFLADIMVRREFKDLHVEQKAA